MRRGAALLLLPAAAATNASAKVRVVMYAEVGCPYTQDFITGGMHTGVQAHGVADIMDFTYHAWGNSYYTGVAGCSGGGFSKDTEKCWIEACNGTAPPSTCFPENGKRKCQHGAGECTGNEILGCAMSLNPSLTAWEPFVYCMAAGSAASACRSESSTCFNAGETCAQQAGLDWSAINACATGADGDAVLRAAAKATAVYGDARYEATPWCLVEGAIVPGDGSTFLAMVCDAYKGTKPSGCP